MEFKQFKESRVSLDKHSDSSIEVIYCYLGTHLATKPEERISIVKIQDGSCILEIENHCYIGEINKLEKILWKWCSDELLQPPSWNEESSHHFP
jgi:hypothetical protein